MVVLVVVVVLVIGVVDGLVVLGGFGIGSSSNSIVVAVDVVVWKGKVVVDLLAPVWRRHSL